MASAESLLKIIARELTVTNRLKLMAIRLAYEGTNGDADQEMKKLSDKIQEDEEDVWD